MTRPARIIVDLEALRANYLHARKMHGRRVVAVLKANAYGHGAVRCALALEDIADAFSVAFTEEAMQLRRAGINSPILILEGAFGVDELALASTHDLWLVVHHLEQVRMLEQFVPPAVQLGVWLKIDTGMHRAGVEPTDATSVWNRLSSCKAVSSIRLMTHLSSADDPTSTATAQQLAQFDSCTAALAGERSVANSAGILGWEGAHRDWARAGLMLYGVPPAAHMGSVLRPVMSLHSAVFAQRWVAPGEAVGYGRHFVADRPTRVGLVAMGYADGYPRSAPSGTPVAVDGHLVQTIGRVSMDMLTIDLTDHPNLGPGSQVELWGTQVPVDSVAAAAGTIPYELLCNVKRAPIGYIKPSVQFPRGSCGIDKAQD